MSSQQRKSGVEGSLGNGLRTKISKQRLQLEVVGKSHKGDAENLSTRRLFKSKVFDSEGKGSNPEGTHVDTSTTSS